LKFAHALAKLLAGMGASSDHQPRSAQMHDYDYWDECADALELSIQGNRLIVREIVDAIGSVWHRLLGCLADSVAGVFRGHLPPV